MLHSHGGCDNDYGANATITVDNGGGDDGDVDDDNDLYVMVKCMSVCLYVRFCLFFSGPPHLLGK